MSPGVPKHWGIHSPICSGVPLAKIAGHAERRAEDRQRDAGVAPGHLLDDHGSKMHPVGSAKHVGHEVERVQADLGRLLDDRPGRLLPLVPLVGGGADHVLGEVVDPLLDLQLVLVELEREVGHVWPPWASARPHVGFLFEVTQ